MRPTAIWAIARDFFLKDNPDIIKDFSRPSPRPHPFRSPTQPARLHGSCARYRFDRFGLYADASPASNQITACITTRDGRARRRRARMELGWSQSITAGSSHASISAGRSSKRATSPAPASISPSAPRPASTSASVSCWSPPIGFHTIEGADVTTGLHLDARSMSFVEPDAVQGFAWTVTPGIGRGGCVVRLAAGGTLLLVRHHQRLPLRLRQSGHSSRLNSTPCTNPPVLDVDEYKIDPGVEQQILKLGGKVQYRLSDGASIYAGAAWTDFLETPRWTITSTSGRLRPATRTARTSPSDTRATSAMITRPTAGG